MSIHKSLKTAGALARHRNVLTRMERLEKLELIGSWSEQDNSVFSLPKVVSRKVVGKKKKKKEQQDEGSGEEAS